MYMACSGMRIYFCHVLSYRTMYSYPGYKLSPAVLLLLGLGQPGDIQAANTQQQIQTLGGIDHLNRIGYEYHIEIV